MEKFLTDCFKKKIRKVCVKRQNVSHSGAFHSLLSPVPLAILRSWNWIKSPGIFFPSLYVNPPNGLLMEREAI